MATYIFKCPQCGESIETDDSYCDMEAECPHCATSIIIPQRPRVVLAKVEASKVRKTGFVSKLKSVAKRDFWTVKHSIIVGQGIFLLLVAICVCFILSGDGTEGNGKHPIHEKSAARKDRNGKNQQSEKLDDDNGAPKTPNRLLLIYAEQGDTAYIEDLLNQNPTLDVNRPRTEGNKTALYLACEKGYSDIAKLLLDRKADATICDTISRGLSGLDGYSSLTIAAKNGHRDVVKCLLSAGVDMESRDDRNRTALYSAAANNRPVVVKFLCDAGAKVNNYGRNRWTPLAGAAYNGNTEVINTLLKYGKGIDLDMRCRGGVYNATPLYLAAIKNHADVVELLCYAGANLELKCGHSNWTPLKAATVEGCADVIKVLKDFDGNGENQECKIGDYTWSYSARRGKATIKGVSPKTGDISIPHKVGRCVVTEIGERAFEDCTYLAKLTLPQSITAIGYSAFSDCENLTSINLPESLKAIEGCTFENCKKIVSVRIPNSVTNIGHHAFSGCGGLSSIELPDNLVIIRNDAFNGCFKLHSLKIPNTVKHVMSRAFKDCKGLTNLKISTGLSNIEEEVFAGCSSIENVTIPDSVKKIHSRAFLTCSSLKYLMIPDSVFDIGYSAFEGCSNLTSVTIGKGVKSIKARAFRGCNMLSKNGFLIFGGRLCGYVGSSRSVTIPNGVTCIEGGAFYDRADITSIKIPSTVKAITGGAFHGCKGLKTVTIPEGVTFLGDGAFGDCTGLTSVRLPSSLTTIGTGTFFNCESIKDLSIPMSVTSIGDNAFCCCKGLTSVTIPNAVTNIGSTAFSVCHLKRVKIPDSVVSIGEGAFSYCADLREVSIPEALADVVSLIFSECPDLSHRIDMRKVEVDRSAERYREKAESGDARAQYYMGMFYFDVEKNVRTASEWLYKSASKGHAGAQFELGQCFFLAWGASVGSKPDYVHKAAHFFRKAADQGHYGAWNMLNMLPADLKNER